MILDGYVDVDPIIIYYIYNIVIIRKKRLSQHMLMLNQRNNQPQYNKTNAHHVDSDTNVRRVVIL